MGKVKRRRVCVFTIHTTKDLRVLNRQCYSLQKNGWEVTLIAIVNKQLVHDSEEGVYYDEGIKVIGIRKWATFWGRIKAIFKIAKEAYRQDVDIYHFHDPDLLIPALFIKLLKRKPIIYDVHEYFNITFSYRFPNIFPLRQVISAFVWTFETITGFLLGNISAVYEEHRRKFARLGCRAVHTPNYASIEDFRPTPVSEEEWNKRKNIVLFIGSLSPVRGSLVLLDVAKQVKDRRSDFEIRVIRRFHNKFQQDAFEEKLSQPGYGNILTLIPNVNGKELPGVIRQAGIGLSVDQETLIGKTSQPTKTFEYMSQALAQVSSDLPHSRKYIQSEGCGILVKADDPKQYADAIIKLIDDPELQQEMGTAGQKAFAERYNWSIIEKRLLEFYELLIR